MTSRPDEPDRTAPLDTRAADEVLRRAAELSTQDLGRTESSYDRRALTDAAAEVGIHPGDVVRALAEHDAGVLAAGPPRRGLLGPSRVVETRLVPHPASGARAVVVSWLRGQLLERDERRGGVEVWRPRRDLGAKVRRKVDARVSRKVRVGEVDAILVSTADAGPDASVVRLEAVFDDMRRGLRTGIVLIPATITPVLGMGAGLLLGEIAFAIGSVPLAGALGGIGTYSGRRTLADQRTAASKTLRSVLDELEG